jgi:hypothetical protein
VHWPPLFATRAVHGALLLATLFGNVDLSKVRGLDAVKYDGPSIIGLDTIYLSQPWQYPRIWGLKRICCLEVTAWRQLSGARSSACLFPMQLVHARSFSDYWPLLLLVLLCSRRE